MGISLSVMGMDSRGVRRGASMSDLFDCARRGGRFFQWQVLRRSELARERTPAAEMVREQ
ncbi:hypothetical protein UB43_07195 [Pseudomonas sp. 21]|nr:hypothetical protein UB43_07195 [Pseudomonas sp. 21]